VAGTITVARADVAIIGRLRSSESRAGAEIAISHRPWAPPCRTGHLDVEGARGVTAIASSGTIGA
jgi:hypothetical protein